MQQNRDICMQPTLPKTQLTELKQTDETRKKESPVASHLLHVLSTFLWTKLNHTLFQRNKLIFIFYFRPTVSLNGV